MLMLASALGGTPAEMDEDEPVQVEMGRREVRVGDRLVPLPAPGQVAPLPGPRLPARA